MGMPKPLVRIQARPLLALVLETLAGSHVSECVVVLGHAADVVEREVDLRSARVVTNSDYLGGMSTSLRAGLRAANPSAAAYLVVLADQPFVASATLNALIDRWARVEARTLIPTFRGRRGNPVLLDRRLAASVDSITGDVGFRALFAERADEILEVAVDDPGVLFDVDTLEQVRALEAKLQEGLPLKEALTELVNRGPGLKDRTPLGRPG